MTASKERPILFSGPMVRAILEGRKTQTRRVVFRDHQDEHHMPWWCIDHWQDGDDRMRCPFAQGMRLWVRETWGLVHCSEEEIDDWPAHRANPSHPPGMGWQVWHREGHPWANDCLEDRGFRWRSPLHMPRWASRLTLEVTGVRVERLQEISEADAIAEGMGRVIGPCGDRFWSFGTGEFIDPVAAFIGLWDSTNGKRHPWASNPWVWVIEFRQVAGGLASPGAAGSTHELPPERV